uniref:Uncharacterized protein n=1 Tax=Mustela putorius furo TaxID=9669 RepID=M3Y7N0_MUSPF
MGEERDRQRCGGGGGYLCTHLCRDPERRRHHHRCPVSQRSRRSRVSPPCRHPCRGSQRSRWRPVSFACPGARRALGLPADAGVRRVARAGLADPRLWGAGRSRGPASRSRPLAQERLGNAGARPPARAGNGWPGTQEVPAPSGAALLACYWPRARRLRVQCPATAFPVPPTAAPVGGASFVGQESRQVCAQIIATLK